MFALVGQTTTDLVGPLMNLGAVGVCLVALAFYYLRKDRAYERRIDERLQAEREHRQELAALMDKYRIALMEMKGTLDAVLAVMRKGGGA